MKHLPCQDIDSQNEQVHLSELRFQSADHTAYWFPAWRLDFTLCGFSILATQIVNFCDLLTISLANRFLKAYLDLVKLIYKQQDLSATLPDLDFSQASKMQQ